jgi:steroid delta-isomerase-like uncharacterized protein
MTRDQMTLFFATRQSHWRKRDPDALAATHAPDGEIVSPIFGNVRGMDAIVASYRRLFTVFPDWSYEGGELIADGQRAAHRFEVEGTHTHELFGMPATGHHFKIQGVQLFRFEHERIAFEQRFYDFTGMLMQIGVLKARPQ